MIAIKPWIISLAAIALIAICLPSSPTKNSSKKIQFFESKEAPPDLRWPSVTTDDQITPEIAKRIWLEAATAKPPSTYKISRTIRDSWKPHLIDETIYYSVDPAGGSLRRSEYSLRSREKNYVSASTVFIENGTGRWLLKGNEAILQDGPAPSGFGAAKALVQAGENLNGNNAALHVPPEYAGFKCQYAGNLCYAITQVVSAQSIAAQRSFLKSQGAALHEYVVKDFADRKNISLEKADVQMKEAAARYQSRGVIATVQRIIDIQAKTVLLERRLDDSGNEISAFAVRVFEPLMENNPSLFTLPKSAKFVVGSQNNN